MSEQEPDDPRYRVLSVGAIWWSAAVLVAIGAAVAVWLLLAYGKGDEQQRNQLDAIRTAGTIVVGTGGAAALLLAARRQRTAEIALRQRDRDLRTQERVAAANEADALQRRITELYTKAVEQLGSDRAPVRLGGLYALERLAGTDASQQQTIVNVLCAYLRMPFDDSAADAVQEREVRVAAQRILQIHLREGEAHWPDMTIDLSGALLYDADFSACRIAAARFACTTFAGGLSFADAWFGAEADFGSAVAKSGARFDRAFFSGPAGFRDTAFAAEAGFTGVEFLSGAAFDNAVFDGPATFGSVAFGGEAGFGTARFAGPARFGKATFAGGAQFGQAHFAAEAVFAQARFEARAMFVAVVFDAAAQFSAVRFGGAAAFGETRFGGDAVFVDAVFAGQAMFGKAVFEAEARFARADFRRDALFVPVRFGRQTPPEVARFLDTESGVA